MCNYSVICNKPLATVSEVNAVLPDGARADGLPVLLGLTRGWREELLLLVVNTKGVGPASSQPCQYEVCSLSLENETVESRLKKKMIRRVTAIVNPYYSQANDRVNESSWAYSS